MTALLLLDQLCPGTWSLGPSRVKAQSRGLRLSPQARKSKLSQDVGDIGSMDREQGLSCTSSRM